MIAVVLVGVLVVVVGVVVGRRAARARPSADSAVATGPGRLPARRRRSLDNRGGL